MRWAEISIEVNCGATEEAASIASDYAAGGVAIFDPSLKAEAAEGLGLSELELEGLDATGPAIIKFYVGDDEQELTAMLSEIRKRLDSLSGCRLKGTNVLSLSVRMADEKEWSSWKQAFKPFRLGARLVVTPSWEASQAEEGDVIIRIDPGQAFGTGQHETTAGCAALLEKYIKGGESVLDVGTGTGILAIAAAKLGAKSVTAVDIDPVAVRCAAENVAANGVTDSVKVVKGDLLAGMSGPYDVVIANILAGPVIEISAPAADILKNGGVFISSGYVAKSEKEVQDALCLAGLAVSDRIVQEDWICLAAVKQDK